MNFLSDIITEKEYIKWQKGNLIFIFSGTGSGKTTLALEELSIHYLEQNKSVLYLVPRRILKCQIEDDVMAVLDNYPDKASEYNPKFNIWTYQQLETDILHNNGKNIPSFDFLICDEYHCFIADSIFRPNTQISYNYIFHNYDNNEKTILLLTATPNGIMDYMITDMSFEEIGNGNIDDIRYEPIQSENENYQYKSNDRDVFVYKLSKNYDYLDIKYFISEDEIMELMKKTKQKSIIFVSSKNKGKRLEKELLEKKINAIYIDAENKENTRKKNVDNLIETKTFPQQVFVTTSVLDVGVNFFDKDIENIVIAHTEPMEFLQMLGRIRVRQTGQRISLFIFQRSTRYFQNLLKKNIIEKIQCWKYLENVKYYEDETKKYYKYLTDKEYYEDEKECFEDLKRYYDRNRANEEENYNYIDEDEYFESYSEREKYKKLPEYLKYLEIKEYYQYLDKEKHNEYLKIINNKKNLDNILYEELKPNNDLPNGYRNFIYLYNCDNRNKIGLNTLAPYYLRKLHTSYGKIYKKMMNGDKNYFIKYQLELLGREDDFSYKNFYCLDCLQKSIESKMKETKNGMLQEECKNMLFEFQPLVRRMNKDLLRSNQNLSIKVFNNFCKTYEINYCIAQKEDTNIKKTKYYLLKSNDDIINQLELTIQL